MKTHLEYNFFRDICNLMANKIRQYEPNELVYIYTSGMSATHIMHNHIGIPIGFYKASPQELNVDQNSQKIVFIDSQINLTKINDIRNFMKTYCQDIQWMVASVIIDDTIDCSNVPELLVYGIKTPLCIEIYR
jgi:hypothetical protein